MLKAYSMYLFPAVGLVVLLLFLYKTGKKETVKQIILSLVVQAEKTLGSGTGELKYAFVVERLYAILPPLLRFLVTQKEIDELIQGAVEHLKKYLSSSKNLLSYEQEMREASSDEIRN